MAKTSGNAGSLFYGMSLNTQDFKKNLKDARKTLAKSGKAMRESFASIAKGGSLVGAAVAGGSVALLAFAKSTAAATNAQLLLADSIDASQAEIAGLEISTERWGVETGMVIDKMREVGGLDEFKNLAEDVKNAGSAQDQLNKSIELFGNEGAKMLPLLQQGTQGFADMEAEAVKLGLALSPQQIAESRVAWEEYEDTIVSIKGLAKQLGTALMEPFGLASSAVKAFIETYREDMIGTFKNVSDFMADAIRFGLDIFNDYGIPLINSFMQAANQIGEVFSTIFNFISDKGGSAFSTLGDLMNGFVDFLATFKDVFVAGVSGAISTVLKGTFNGLSKLSDFLGDLITEIAFGLSEIGAIDESLAESIAISFGDQSANLRRMGKDLAKPFQQAQEDALQSATDTLIDLDKKNEKDAFAFKSVLLNFDKNFKGSIKDAAKIPAQIASSAAKESQNRASLIESGSQEEARLLAGSSDKNLELQKQQLRAQENTNSILKAIGSV